MHSFLWSLFILSTLTVVNALPTSTSPTQSFHSFLSEIENHLLAYIQASGDSQIPPGVHAFRSDDEDLELTYDSQPQWRMMRYSDLLAVTRGLRAKVMNQGFREWGAVVLWRGEDGREVETGEVDLGPLPVGGVDTS